jgi:hypothetical protein
LDAGRAFWIWGDTLYGHVKPNKERAWSAMPHNAIGLLDVSEGAKEKGFTHYITLQHDGLFYPESANHEKQRAKGDDDEYYWVLQGVLLCLYSFTFC